MERQGGNCVPFAEWSGPFVAVGELLPGIETRLTDGAIDQAREAHSMILALGDLVAELERAIAERLVLIAGDPSSSA